LKSPFNTRLNRQGQGALKITAIIKRNWFLFGLLFAAVVTLADGTGTIARMGAWVSRHHGAEGVMFLIFFLSGVSLAADQIKSGVSDFKTTILTLFIIFAVAPALGAVFTMAPLGVGIKIGLILVSIMPTTLSSGVVMTGASGGNITTALMITVLANALGIFTVPYTLGLFIGADTGGADIVLNKGALMVRIAFLVALPLFLGLLFRRIALPVLKKAGLSASVINQCAVLFMVWTALSKSRTTIVNGLEILWMVIPLAMAFHAALLSFAVIIKRLFRIERGRYEALIFMGAQKTLPLSLLIQVTLFPQYGEALVMCVVHHMVHLMMDSYIVGWIARRKGRS